jgi:hypothetical protein
MSDRYENEFVALRLCLDLEDDTLRVGLFARGGTLIERATAAEHVLTCVALRTGTMSLVDSIGLPRSEPTSREVVICDPGGVLPQYDGLGTLVERLVTGCESLLSELVGRDEK